MNGPALTDEQKLENALKPFGWKCGPGFWKQYYSDPWVFNLANAVERLSGEVESLTRDRDAWEESVAVAVAEGDKWEDRAGQSAWKCIESDRRVEVLTSALERLAGLLDPKVPPAPEPYMREIVNDALTAISLPEPSEETEVKPASACCYATVEDGNCTWCGHPATATDKRDKLYVQLDTLLCDWNAPSKLATYDLAETVAKVRRFILVRDVALAKCALPEPSEETT